MWVGGPESDRMLLAQDPAMLRTTPGRDL